MNDGRFPDGQWVVTCYPEPSAPDAPRETWPWWVATVEQQGGEDEWQLMVWGRELAELEDGSPAPAATPDDDLYYPLCFRSRDEILQVPPGEAETIRDRGGRFRPFMTEQERREALGLKDKHLEDYVLDDDPREEEDEKQ